MIHVYSHRADILSAEHSDPGVYFILNTMSNRMRIGQSRGIFNRMITHYGQLRAGSHTNIALQEDWTTFGEHNFEFGILITIPRGFYLHDDERHLRDLETHFMKVYQTKNPIYGYDFDTKKNKPKEKVYEGFFAFVERYADQDIEQTLGKAAHL
jgi:hypothetical protein